MASSNDLGGIQGPPTAHSDSVRSIDTSKSGDVGGLMDVIGGLVKRGQRDAFDDALEDTVAEATLKEGAEVEDGGRIAPVTGNKEADDLLDKVYRLEDARDQLSGSQKNSVDLALRNTYQEFATKYPGQKSQFAQQLSRFERTDPELAMLDMFGEIDKQGIAESQGILDGMNTYAIDTLGMPPDVIFGSIEWARMYKKRDSHVQKKITNDQFLEATESDQNISIDRHLEIYEDGMTGEISDIVEFRNRYADDVNAVAVAAMDPTAPGAKETLLAFESGNQAILMREADAMKAMAIRRFHAIPLKYSDNPKYTKAKAVFDSHMEMLDMLTRGIAEQDATLIASYQTYEVAAAIDFERENREVVSLARKIKQFEPVLKMGLTTFNAEGLIIQDEVGKASNMLLQAMLGNDVAMSTGDNVPVNSTVSTQRDAIVTGFAGVKDPFNMGLETAKERRKEGAVQAAVSFDPEYLNLVVTGSTTPSMADTHMSAQAARYVYIRTQGKLEVDGAKVLLESWSDPRVVKMAELASQHRPSTPYLAASEMSHVRQAYESERINAYTKLRNETLQGNWFDPFVADDVFNINTSKAKDGIITVDINMDDFNSVVKMTNGAVQYKQQLNAVRRHAEDLGALLTKDLKWITHIQSVANGTFKPDYQAEWDASFDIRTGLIHPQGDVSGE